jgi:uncharacterized protein YacL
MKIIRPVLLVIIGIIGGYLGWWLGTMYVNLPAISKYIGTNGSIVLTSKLGFGVIGLLAGGLAYTKVSAYIEHLADNLREMPANDKIALFVGALIGLLLTFLLVPILNLNSIEDWMLRTVLTASVLVLMVFLTTQAALSMREELRKLLSPGGAAAVEDKGLRSPRILDTNIVIDGRISDICRTGFLDGTIYIPGFVLDELQLIADSGDSLKRARGRRGLDILNAMQKEFPLVVRTYDHLIDKFGNEPVDRKLVLLAKEMDGIIVTNDFNLNKVAELQGVTVLNVNELANALKPVVLPGELMHVHIIKEGKEQGQGIAYLDDGTMVVVENGRRHVGETVDVSVASVLQTVAGKMIFSNLKDVAEAEEEAMDRNLRNYYRPNQQRRPPRH